MTAATGRPERVFDAHFHIIDPAHPLAGNDGYLPEPFTIAQYRERVSGLKIAGGAVVSGSFQGFDQGYLLDALRALGPGYVGVTQVPASITDEQIRSLDQAGVRAVRFNVRRGGSAALAHFDQLARRVHAIAGWHAELYIDARDLPDLADRIAALPAVGIDHLGLHEEGLNALLDLVRRGVKVKATGFGRIDFDPARAIKAIMEIDPTALMAGTDLPSTRARRPFDDKDFDYIQALLDPDQISAVFWDNAASFYLRSNPHQSCTGKARHGVSLEGA